MTKEELDQLENCKTYKVYKLDIPMTCSTMDLPLMYGAGHSLSTYISEEAGLVRTNPPRLFIMHFTSTTQEFKEIDSWHLPCYFLSEHAAVEYALDSIESNIRTLLDRHKYLNQFAIKVREVPDIRPIELETIEDT